MSSFDVYEIRKDFPILFEKINSKQICYFDNGASSQKPKAVLDVIKYYTFKEYANIHRGVYQFSENITFAYENARKIVHKFLNSESENDIIFTKNATESINLVANVFCSKLGKGDTVLITEMEHHANIVPWYLMSDKYGFDVKVVNVLSNGTLDFDDYCNKLGPDVKLVSFTHVSNVTGVINPVKKMIDIAKEYDAYVLLDASQSVMHQKIDVLDLGVDFLVFTGHKIFAPTGIGVLYGRQELMNSFDPFLGGGDMIKSVSFNGISYADSPARFEAGTPPIVEAIALGRAIEYVEKIGFENIKRQEEKVYQSLLEGIKNIEGVTVFGDVDVKAPVISFCVDGVNNNDIGTLLNMEGICVRIGKHCAEPLIEKFGVSSTLRASLCFYNTVEETAYFIEKINKVIGMLR